MARLGYFRRNRALRERLGPNGFHQFGRHPGDWRGLRDLAQAHGAKVGKGRKRKEAK